METCDLCGGPLMLLGQLRNRVHVQCRNCGMQFSHVKNTDPLYMPDIADDEIVICGCGATHRHDENCPNGCDD